MELVSWRKHRGSTERGIKCRTIKGNWLILTILVQIFLVSSVISETIKYLRKEDTDSPYFGVTSKTQPRSRNARFIRFDPKAGNVDIDLEVKIPFLSIPLENINNHTGLPAFPVVKLNYKSLVFFGTLMALVTFVIPLLFSQVPNQPSNLYNSYHPIFAKEHKRSDRGLDITSYFGDSLNEILANNSTLAPCIERFVCSAVATAKHADEPTNFDVIVDTLSSHSLFEEAVNGTTIKDAAAKGREVLSAEDCATTTSECAINHKILLNVLKMIGL